MWLLFDNTVRLIELQYLLNKCKHCKNVVHINVVFCLFCVSPFIGQFPTHRTGWTLHPLSDSPDPAAILQLTFQNYFFTSKINGMMVFPRHSIHYIHSPRQSALKLEGQAVNLHTIWDKLDSERTRLQLGHHYVKGYRCRVNGVKINYMAGSPNWYLPQHEDNTQSIIFVLSAS